MADRPTFTPVFEESESTIRDRVVGRVSDAWRKEPGDFIYDAVAPSPAEVKQLQANQDFVLKQAFAQYAEGEYLDRKLAEVGLTRIPAIKTTRSLNIEADAGVIIPAGYSVSTVILDGQGDPVEFTVDNQVTYAVSGTLAVAVTCKTAGVIGNVPDGSQFILSPPIAGVKTITDAGAVTLGADTETDLAAWERYDFKVKNPDTGGNKNDYVRWATEVDGVKKAKTVPRWNGNGTVKVLLIGIDYKPALQAVVDEVQEYLDPGVQGLGEGKAPCGAAVTAAAAADLPIAIAATLTLLPGYTLEGVTTAFNTAFDNYLAGLAFENSPDGNQKPVVYAQVGSLLINTAGVSNYVGLTVNGAAADVAVGAEQVATRGAVNFV